MHRKRSLLLLFFLTAVVAVAIGWLPAPGVEARGPRVEVTITNLTKGQILSPAVVALHDEGLAPLFMPGAPASDELRQIAEDAVNQPMMDLLTASPHVGDVATFPEPIPPGATETVVLQANASFRLVSLVAMLVTTNDAFTGVNALAAFPRPRTVDTGAYDAGTEENNEICSFIPGPPCDSPEVRAMNGEGFVHVHAGVHGIADLMPETHDWRNPVARITVKRVR